MLDPGLSFLLAALGEQSPEVGPPDVDRHRAAMRSLIAQLNADREPPADLSIESIVLADNSLPARLYSPHSTGPDAPLVLFLHGGGFVFGDLETHDIFCRRLAVASEAKVVSLAYRLAPEHPFPAAHDDGWAALLDLPSRAKEIGFDPQRFILCGDSAGATLATVLTHFARDRQGPLVRAQILLCPSTDFAGSHASRIHFGEGYLLSNAEISWCLDQFLPAGVSPADPRVSPLHAEDLTNLPPALVVTAGFDPLQDEGRLYAERLDAAGNEVELLHFSDLIHGFNLFDAVSPAAATAVAMIGDKIRSLSK